MYDVMREEPAYDVPLRRVGPDWKRRPDKIDGISFIKRTCACCSTISLCERAELKRGDAYVVLDLAVRFCSANVVLWLAWTSSFSKTPSSLSWRDDRRANGNPF